MAFVYRRARAGLVCSHFAYPIPFRKGGRQSRYGADLCENSRSCARRHFGTVWSEDMNDTMSRSSSTLKSLVVDEIYRDEADGNPPSGQRNLSSHGPSFPTCRKVVQRERQDVLLRRIRNGFARAIESLRGMRLSLVESTNTGKCVLQ